MNTHKHINIPKWGDTIYKDDLDNILFFTFSAPSRITTLKYYGSDIFNTYAISVNNKNILVSININENCDKWFPIIKYNTLSNNELDIFELYDINDNSKLICDYNVVIYTALFNYGYIKKALKEYIYFIDNFEKPEHICFNSEFIKIITQETIYDEIIKWIFSENVSYIANIVQIIYDFYMKNNKYLLHQKHKSILMYKCSNILRCIKNNILILKSIKYDNDINNILDKIIFITADD